MKPRFIGFVATGMLCLGFVVPSVRAAESATKGSPSDRTTEASDPGDMTPEEATQLEQRAKELRRQIAQGRSVNGGTMGQAERSQLRSELDGISSRLYRYKHRPPTPASRPSAAVAKTEKAQPTAGTASGQPLPAEARQLEVREAELRRQIAAGRSASGGKLSVEEREQLTLELDRIGASLARQKQDGQATQEK